MFKPVLKALAWGLFLAGWILAGILTGTLLTLIERL